MSLKKECWPDPVGMAEEMRGLGVELMITHWPCEWRAPPIVRHRRRTRRATARVPCNGAGVCRATARPPSPPPASPSFAPPPPPQS